MGWFGKGSPGLLRAVAVHVSVAGRAPVYILGRLANLSSLLLVSVA